IGAGTVSVGPRNVPPPCGFGCAVTQIDRALDIDPTGAGISVRLSDVFLLSTGTFGMVTIDEGGAIRNRGTLVVADSTVLGEAVARGGGVFSIGPLRVGRSHIAGLASSGAGISALDPLDVIDTTIAPLFTSSLNGDGISAAGPVTLVNTTVSGNRDGVIVAGSATLVNSTISGNTGGGIVA